MLRGELEDYLYGEMHDEDEEKHGGDTERGKGGREDISETKEHEVRIRSDVVRMVLNKAIGPDGLYTENSEVIVEGEPAKKHSAYSAIYNVLLSNIRLITRKGKPPFGEAADSSIALLAVHPDLFDEGPRCLSAGKCRRAHHFGS